MESLIPVFGMVTGIIITATCVWGGVQILRGPVGQALARWISGPSGSADSALTEEVEQLRHTLAGMESHVAELEERLDFTERMLARQSESAALGRGGQEGAA
ncbi:MAG: hypothetical protein ACREMH_10210 [Gemmatimonadales bacterium]